MTEPLYLNKLPLNQRAKKHLLAVGEQPGPNYLYSLQLAVWLLEKHPHFLGLAAYNQENLEQQANLMLGWEPKNSQGWLCSAPDEPLKDAAKATVDQLRELNELDDPVDMGGRLAMNLWENLEEARRETSPT